MLDVTADTASCRSLLLLAVTVPCQLVPDTAGQLGAGPYQLLGSGALWAHSSECVLLFLWKPLLKGRLLGIKIPSRFTGLPEPRLLEK